MSSLPTLEPGAPPPANERVASAPAGGSLLVPAPLGAAQAPARSGWMRTLALPFLAVLLNLALGAWTAERFGLPLALEHTGTVLAGLLLGPVAGALVGAVSMAIQSLLPNMGSVLPVLLPAIWMGWVAGVAGRRDALRRPLRLLLWAAGATLGAGMLTLLMDAAPQGGVGYWSGLADRLAAGLPTLATPEGALATYGGPLLSFLLGAALAWLPAATAGAN